MLGNDISPFTKNDFIILVIKFYDLKYPPKFKIGDKVKLIAPDPSLENEIKSMDILTRSGANIGEAIDIFLNDKLHIPKYSYGFERKSKKLYKDKYIYVSIDESKLELVNN